MSPPTILVTGASSGLGKAIAERLAAGGARVVGTSRHAATDGPIAASGLTMAQLDICDDVSVASLKNRLQEAGALPATIVLNAGFGISGAIEETPVDAARAQFDTNLLGAHRVVQAFLPSLRARGGGRLIVIGSLAGRIALPFQGFYSASKAALAAYAAALRIELRPFGIDVTLVEPGDHRTGFPDRRQPPADRHHSPYEPQQSRVLAAMIASEQAGASPESLADAVVHLTHTRGRHAGFAKASAFERLFLLLHRVLPAGPFQLLVRRAYGLD
ncbi:SDR family NAD(P)-dependent oxidoreductase [Sandaracinobacteroides saxicola]|nr:SDR family NAD(P)-dependent oxidoreductase [Sandaracinobacteroides saxicola]